MKKSKEIKPKYTASLQKKTVRTVQSLQKTTTKKEDPTNVASKGLKYPASPSPAVVKKDATFPESKRLAAMDATGYELPTAQELQVMKQQFIGDSGMKSYIDLARSREENNFSPTYPPKYMKRQAKKIAVKMRKSK